jgi:hypothetical protein
VPRLGLFTLVAALVLGVFRPAVAGAEPARSAGSFVDSVGVNTHLIYDDTAYGDFAGVRSRLRELGVRHIRDGVCGTCAWQWGRYEALASDGIRLDAGAGWPTATLQERRDTLAAMRRLAPMIDTVEGANEWDLFSGRTAAWAGQVREHQAWWADAVRTDPALHSIPLIGPSLVFSWETPSSWTTLGDVSANLDYGNSHGYAGGLPPELAADAELARARAISGDKPVVQTEGGYHNALDQGNWDHPAVPEDVAGAYLPRLFLENFRRGILRTYSYELLDEWAGLAATDMEASFGLLRSDLSRKPAFVSVRNLLTILADGPASQQVADVPVTVSVSAADVRQLVLRKADGRVDVILWRPASLWDRDARARLAVPTTPVAVSYAAPVSAATTYTPVASADGRAVTLSAGAVTLAVGAAPVILELTPAAAAPVATPTPVPPAPAPAPPAPPVAAPTAAPSKPTGKPAPRRKPVARISCRSAKANAKPKGKTKARAKRCQKARRTRR